MVCPCELLEGKQWVYKKRVPDKAFKWLSPRSGVAIYCNSHKTRRKTLLKSISFWVSDTSAKVPLLLGKGLFMKTSCIFCLTCFLMEQTWCTLSCKCIWTICAWNWFKTVISSNNKCIFIFGNFSPVAKERKDINYYLGQSTSVVISNLHETTFGQNWVRTKLWQINA